MIEPSDKIICKTIKSRVVAVWQRHSGTKLAHNTCNKYEVNYSFQLKHSSAQPQQADTESHKNCATKKVRHFLTKPAFIKILSKSVRFESENAIFSILEYCVVHQNSLYERCTKWLRSLERFIEPNKHGVDIIAECVEVPRQRNVECAREAHLRDTKSSGATFYSQRGQVADGCLLIVRRSWHVHVHVEFECDWLRMNDIIIPLTLLYTVDTTRYPYKSPTNMWPRRLWTATRNRIRAEFGVIPRVLMWNNELLIRLYRSIGMQGMFFLKNKNQNIHHVRQITRENYFDRQCTAAHSRGGRNFYSAQRKSNIEDNIDTW